MFVPSGTSCFEFTEKKSRFIAEISPISTPKEAREILKEKKTDNPAATHVVHAFITGPDRQFMGMSDDGEPPGTSGRPVLDALKSRNLTNIVLTVVRYFGGTKLGTGGLARAYSKAANGALDMLAVKKLVSYKRFELNCEYHFYETLKKIINEYNGKIEKELFEIDVSINGQIPETSVGDFKKSITENSFGKTNAIIFDDIFQV